MFLYLLSYVYSILDSVSVASDIVGVVCTMCVFFFFYCFVFLFFFFLFSFFFFQAEDGIRDLVRSRGLGDVYKRQRQCGQCPDGQTQD